MALKPSSPQGGTATIVEPDNASELLSTDTDASSRKLRAHLIRCRAGNPACDDERNLSFAEGERQGG